MKWIIFVRLKNYLIYEYSILKLSINKKNN